MSFFSIDDARPAGPGLHSPAGSIRDRDLATTIMRYKRNVASRYRAFGPDEMSRLYDQRMLISPKIDGETWFLIWDDGRVALANPRGRVLSGPIPVLDEARRVSDRVKGRLVLPGELYALRKGGRPRHGDLASAVSAGEMERVGFTAFDLIDPDTPDDGSLEAYAARLERMNALLDGGKRLRAIATTEGRSAADVEAAYAEFVTSEKAEGLVVRVPGRTFKVKPVMHVDAVVLGYTLRGDDPEMVRSTLIGLAREDGQFQVIGSCGNLGSEDDRRAMKERLTALDAESEYRHASSDGALYQFVRPELVFEIKVNDIQAESSDGEPIPRMVIEWDGHNFTAVRKLPGVSLLGPILSRIRDDKSPTPDDAGIDQVIDRVMLLEAETRAEAIELPYSDLVRREVFTKVTKERMAVRKLLIWKTNKEEVDPRYPAFVVHWTDYSPTRKDPLQRTVRLAPDADTAHALGDELAQDGYKRGWDKVQ